MYSSTGLDHSAVKSLYSTNKIKSMSSNARIKDAHGVNFVRDACTGTWFRDRPENRKDFHYTGSSLNMKFTEMASEKTSASGGFRQTQNVYSAPVAGGFWVEKNPNAPKSMIIVSTGDLSHSSRTIQDPLVKTNSLPQLKKNTNSLRKSAQIDKQVF